MKKYIDEKFLLNKRKYIMQCLMVILFISFILFYLDVVFQAALVTSLGATSFIIFTGPHKNSTRLQYIAGGYITGIIVGCLCFLGSNLVPFTMTSVWGALAIGISMLLMTVFNFEHPPAAGVALGIAVDGMNIKTMFMIFAAITLLLLVRRFLRSWLIDLI